MIRRIKMKKKMTKIAMFLILSIISIIGLGAKNARDPFEFLLQADTSHSEQFAPNVNPKSAADFLKTKTTIRLTGIVFAENDSYAIIAIGDKSFVCNENASFGEIRLVHIFPDHVVIKTSEKSQDLEIGKTLKL